ncbi:uncharacterized protein PRCAT00006358001 [Priceomyces carsonii]|uniref:uncharacterized protein n=1 Tax=Priceomyces carsonii TaxID=28549 RepID=UPI002EDB6F3A|nr:unnamed protein product [Priceomyces carsonii]
MMSKTIDSNTSRPGSPSLLVKQQSLKKLFNSHLSIYNALTNPDLDVGDGAFSRMSPERRLTPEMRVQVERGMSPELKESQFSITSWQSISNESVLQQIKPTSSILSVTSDEDDAPVLVNYMQLPLRPSHVLVFETDEEDDDVTPSSFIMPKLPVSNSLTTSKKIEVTVLSSCNNFNFETNQLINKIEREVNFNLISIRHLNLNSKILKFDEMITKNSDLIFIVNDGSLIFVDFLSSINFDESCLPKLTIINMITNNYFINLFDLINRLKPYQIWKASSLKQENLFDKFKSFIEIEINQFDDQFSMTQTSANPTKKRCQSLSITNSYSMDLVPKSKTDYKLIEKRFKTDLKDSTNLNDPLQLSSRFFRFNILISIFNKCFASANRYWLACCFGIGMGIGITSGLAFVKFYLTESNSRIFDPLLAGGNSMAEFSEPDFSRLFDAEFFKKLGGIFESYVNELKFFSSFIFDCVRGGFAKAIGLFCN